MDTTFSPASVFRSQAVTGPTPAGATGGNGIRSAPGAALAPALGDMDAVGSPGVGSERGTQNSIYLELPREMRQAIHKLLSPLDRSRVNLSSRQLYAETVDGRLADRILCRIMPVVNFDDFSDVIGLPEHSPANAPDSGSSTELPTIRHLLEPDRGRALMALVGRIDMLEMAQWNAMLVQVQEQFRQFQTPQPRRQDQLESITTEYLALVKMADWENAEAFGVLLDDIALLPEDRRNDMLELAAYRLHGRDPEARLQWLNRCRDIPADGCPPSLTQLILQVGQNQRLGDALTRAMTLVRQSWRADTAARVFGYTRLQVLTLEMSVAMSHGKNAVRSGLSMAWAEARFGLTTEAGKKALREYVARTT
ncbi:hypothetical protein SAMN05216359_102472 [Roseateles sp. YR242]|uniref:hypothetical protein n=1 Tax=Roseateles sp. YR242 TaxID=1855305 RepID=UPI0008D804A8|nr:hypothetical protein [Roseateles sp. YR242]SEK63168.1 hypothetical protein SAMN05216359_102472 [Roseateles sp. YR242]